jgi:MFS family permease
VAQRSGSSPRSGDRRPGGPVVEILALVQFPGIVALVMVLPVVMVGPLAFAIRQDYTFTQSDIGASFAAFFMTSALVSGLGGRLVDRVGTDNVVRIGLLGAATVAASLALSSSRWAIYGATLVGGALNGLTAIAISLAIMSRVVPHRRGLAFGLRTAGIPSAAAVAGLGAYLVAADVVHWRHCLWFTAALACFGTLSVGRGDRQLPLFASTPSTPGPVGSDKTLRALGVSGLLGSTGTAVVTPFLVEGLIAQGESPGRAASVLAVAGWFGIGSRVLVGGLSDRVPDPLTHLRASACFLGILAISMVCLAVGHGPFLLIGATLMAFGLGLAWPGLLLFAALATHRNHASRAAGSMQFGQHSGAVLGPLYFGFLVAHRSFSTAWVVTAVCCLVSASLLLLVARALRGQPGTPAPV